MISFKRTIEKFAKKGEKSGWTYILIESKYAKKMNPGCRVSFRVKGKLDNHLISGLSLLPMGNGDYILLLNASVKKTLNKKQKDSLSISMTLDDRIPVLSPDLIKCLKDDPAAFTFFKSIPKSHQFYYSNWIESAKTISTKTRRITMAVMAMGQKQSYGEMMRAYRSNPLS